MLCVQAIYLTSLCAPLQLNTCLIRVGCACTLVFEQLTHPCLYILRWLHLLDNLHPLPQDVALAVVLDFLASLQSEDEHDDESDGDQEAEHYRDGLRGEKN